MTLVIKHSNQLSLSYSQKPTVLLPFNKLSKPNVNKAIRDGKYLARHMPVLGNVHPIKIEKNIRDVISLLARVAILFIDTATQEVPMNNI